LAQDTFVKAFRSLPAFDPTRRLSSWLFRIAHNAGIDNLRRSRASRTQPPGADRPGSPGQDVPSPPVPDPVERQALGEALQDALSHLRPDQRTAIVLRYEEGLPFEEIGRVLGIPETTARSHVHRARKDLARRLSQAGWEPSR
jgi:RNA polymerase sigma-70 factor, ECF subfamily